MKGRIWIWVVSIILLFILLLPTIVSTSIGKNAITNLASEISGFNINAEKLSLGWLGPQKLENIHGKSIDRGINFDIDAVEIDRGLLHILTSFSLGQVNVIKPVFYSQPKVIDRQPIEETQEASRESNEDDESFNETFVLPFERLNIRDGSFRIVNLDGTITRIDQGDVLLEKKEDLYFFTGSGASIEKENKGTFSLDAVLDPNAILVPQKIQAHFVDFPTKVIDELVRVFYGNFILNLHDLIGPSLSFHLDRSNQKYDIAVKSEFLNGSGLFEHQGEFYIAENPLKLSWDAQKNALNAIFKELDLPFQMNDDVKINATLFDLVGNPLEFKSSFNTQFSPTSLTLKQDGSILELSSLSIDSKVNSENDKREIAGLGLLDFEGIPFSMNIRGETKLDLTTPVCIEDCLKGQWSILMEKMPIKLLQLFIQERHPLDEIFGPSISLNLGLTQRKKETTFGFRVFNDTISSSAWFQFILGKNYLTLKKPVELQFKPLKGIPFSVEGKEYVIDPKSIVLKLDSLEIPKTFEPYTSSFSANLTIDDATFGTLPLQMIKSDISLNKKKFSKIELLTKNHFRFFEQFESYFGSLLTLKSKTSVVVPKSQKWSVDLLSLNISSDKLKSEAEVSIDQDFQLKVLSDILIEYITPSIPFEKLVQPSTLNLVIDSSKTMIDLKNYGNSKFKGHLSGTPLVIQEQNGNVVSLEDFEANVFGNIPDDLIQIALKGKTGVAGDDQKGFLDLNLEMTDLFFAGKFSPAHACFNGKASLEKFPSLLLSPFLKDYPLLGSQFNAELNGIFLCNQDPTGSMTFQFDSETLNVISRFKLDQQFIKLYSHPQQQNLVSFNLSLQNAKKLIPEKFNLKSPISAKIVLDHLAFPNPFTDLPNLNELLNRLEGLGSIQLSTIAIDGYSIPALQGGFEFGVDEEPITINIHSGNKDDLQFQFSLDRPIKPINFWTDLNLETLFHGKNLPLNLFAHLFNVDSVINDKLDVLFDNNAEIRLELSIEDKMGPLDLLVRGSNCALHIPAQIDGTNLKLKEPLTMTMNVTPVVGKEIIGDIVPLLSTTLTAEAPITLIIYPELFNLPLNDWQNTEIGGAELNLGTLILSVDQDIEEILSFLKFDYGRQVEVQATPVYFNLKNQTLNLERFDFLVAKRFPLALWGQIDFPKNIVNLKLGLSASTLESVFDITHLPSDFILPLSLKGTLNDVSLDKTKATGRIAALVAESKGSPEGLLLGNLIQLLSGSFKEEPAPPPTTDPLPWTEGKTQKPKQSEELKKVMKGLEESAKSLFKKLK